VLGKRLLIVGGASAVRRADLHEARARLGHDVGHPKGAADLDELAARHQNFFFRGQRVERQDHRGGAIVHHERVLGAGDLFEQSNAMRVSRATLTSADVVLEVAESFRDLFDGANGDTSERSAAKVGVKNYTGSIDDATQRRASGVLNCGSDCINPLLLGAVLATGAADSLDGVTHCVEHDTPRMLLQ